jgi:phage FluMu gp28-like protein
MTLIPGLILMASVGSHYFLPYQAAWIKDDARTALVEKSRRIGFTYAEAYRSVERRVRLGSDHWFASRDLDSAVEFLEDCKLFARVMNVAARDLGEQVIDEDRGLKARVLEFANGSRIKALSSNPDVFRGKGGDITLDEFAFHKKQRAVLKAANAAAKIWGHQIRIISTHNGEGSLFNQLVRQVRAGTRPTWSLHRVTLQDAVDQGFAERVREVGSRKPLGSTPPDPELRLRFIADVRADCVDETEWAEEYCCVPNADSSAYLNYELIDRCRVPGLVLYEDAEALAANLLPGSVVYAGNDIGRRHDLWVLWALEPVGDVYWTRMLRVLRKATFSQQAGVLNRLLAQRQVRRVAMDQTGMGEAPVESAQERWGRHRVEGCILSAQRKAALAAPFKGLFEDVRIRIPADDDLREDLHKPRKIVSPGGDVRIVAESDTDGHADRFWAGALAVEAADLTHSPLPPPRARKPAGW